MNAIIGDNGIITRAQEANIQSSIASLEEFLQLKYTENYEEMAKYQSKIEGLTNVCSEYFYIPIKEGIGGLWYVVDSDGHALYLIKKSGLPEEIRESLVGGDAGEGSYADYQSLNDVYGVTTNLKVYYCSGGVDTIKGLAKESLDSDNPLREVFDESSKMAGLLSGYDVNNDGKINAEEVKSVKTFTIDEKSGITDLSDLYNLNGLQELTLQNIKLDSFAGIENCSQINYICLENFTSDDYSKINSLENKLQYLYLINTTDDEVKKLCSPDKGIAKGAFSRLHYFALSGYELSVNNVDNKLTNSSIHNNKLTDISALSNLNVVTKEAITYLSLNNNKITSISCLEDFKNVYLLRAETNNLTTLSGVKNMNGLRYLWANNNNLGEKEEAGRKNELSDSLADLGNKVNLYFVRLDCNNNLKWIDYLKNSVGISYFYLAGCGNLQGESLRNIKDIYNKCAISCRSIDSNLEKYLSGSDVFSYANLTEDDISDINYLIYLPQEDKNKVKKFDLSGSTLSNEILNNILEGYDNVVCLNVRNCTQLSTFDFLDGNTSLEQILFDNTAVEGNKVSKLNTTNCMSFSCNNPNIDISAMVKTINRCGHYAERYSFVNYLGAGINGSSLLKKLEGCSELKNLETNGMSSEKSILIDLSNTSLVYLYDQSGNDDISWKLPSCFTGYRTGSSAVSHFWSVKIDAYIFSNQTKIEALLLATNGRDGFSEWYQNVLSNLRNSNSTVKKLLLSKPENLQTFSSFLEQASLENCGIENLDIGAPTTKMDISNLNESWYANFKEIKEIKFENLKLSNLNFLKNSSNLETVSLKNCSIIDVSGISKLQSLAILKLPNNEISNTYYLKDLKTLNTIDLSSNALQSQYNYEENGIMKIVNNLETLANLNKNAVNGGRLEYLYLKGNNLLTDSDYDYLKRYSWADWSGFNGK